MITIGGKMIELGYFVCLLIILGATYYCSKLNFYTYIVKNDRLLWKCDGCGKEISIKKIKHFWMANHYCNSCNKRIIKEIK
jgi:hypothetical protein